jgi:hypothetical protein
MLDRLINQTWKTNTTIRTDNQGSAAFRGFFGEYEISLSTPDGKTHFLKVHVTKNEENRWVFTID